MARANVPLLAGTVTSLFAIAEVAQAQGPPVGGPPATVSAFPLVILFPILYVWAYRVRQRRGLSNRVLAAGFICIVLGFVLAMSPFLFKGVFLQLEGAMNIVQIDRLAGRIATGGALLAAVGGLVGIGVAIATAAVWVGEVRINMDPGARMISLPLAGGLLGGSLGFVLRPTNPLVGQLPLGTVITRGAYLEGMDRLIVPLAEYSFNVMLGGLLAGAIAGALIAYLMQQPRARTGDSEVSSPEATKACPFCAETIKVAANVCRFCGHNLAEDIARSGSEASTSEDPKQ
jgi:hypothetical protein